MAYAKDLDDDISILSISQLEHKEFNYDSKKSDRDSYSASQYASQLALREMKERYRRVEEKNQKYQETKNRLVCELNEMKQAKNKWIKEIIDKDITCNQLRQKVELMSLEMPRLYKEIAKLSDEKEVLENSLSNIQKSSDKATKYPRNIDENLNSSAAINNHSPKKETSMFSLDDYSHLIDQEEYHSHRKHPEAPCACLLTPCASAVDSDSNIEQMIHDCRDFKDDLVIQTESLKNSISALKTVLKSNNGATSAKETCFKSSDIVDEEQDFKSNVATFNSETNTMDFSMQPIEDEETLHSGMNDTSHQKNTSNLDKEDRSCPICDAIYPKMIPFIEYEAHVLSHFDSEGEEILHNFEVVGNLHKF